MRNFARWFALSPFLSTVLCCVASAVCGADDARTFAADSLAKRPESSADTNLAENREKLDFYRRRLREQRLFVEDRGDKPCEFVEDPLTRWDNPISQNGDGLMFLWTDRGRPVAVMNNYYHRPSQIWGRVFISLANRPMEMRIGDQPLWKPRLPGTSFKPLDDSKPPADKAPARLAQMRSIAKEFQVVCKWGGRNKTDWQLRLLPTPLYRYQFPEEGVVDGAMFGYVQSGPEAVLLLEARQTPTGLEWHYAATRCTNYHITFSHHDTTVFESPHFDEWPITDTFFGIRVPMKDYPFGDPFANTKAANTNNAPSK